jgi:hypothetical protein
VREFKQYANELKEFSENYQKMNNEVEKEKEYEAMNLILEALEDTLDCIKRPHGFKLDILMDVLVIEDYDGVRAAHYFMDCLLLELKDKIV